MSVTNKDPYVKGNTVLVPDYNPSKEYKDEKYKKLEKAKREALEKQKKQMLKRKMSTLRVIALVFVVGIFLIYRYSTIYKMEAKLTNTKSQVSNLKSENENLKMTLAKNNNISDIETYSINNLHMEKPSAIDAIKVDLDKNNFKPAESNNSSSSSFLHKVKKILF